MSPGQSAAGAAGLRTASQWESWLRHAERFADLGFTNTMLIWAQRPDATVLRDYAGWKRSGRQVIRGARGVRIIAAGSLPEQVRTLFDLLQTEGPPIAVPARYSAARTGQWDVLTSLALRAGFSVQETGALNEPGIRWDDRVIWAVRGDAPALAEQVAHVLVHDERHLGGERCERVPWKTETDSVAFLISLRLGMDTRAFAFPHVTTWAGTDPRAHPEAIITAIGDRVLHAATKAFACIDTNTRTPLRPVGGPRLARPAVHERTPAVRDDTQVRIQVEAARFFYRRRQRSWVPGYMASRGLDTDALRRWGIGYAPGEWTALTDHLRQAGFSDAAIEASGLAKRSSRGTLFDVFRDRVMFPIRSLDGRVLGFTGRAAPSAAEGVPKYLNSRETALYRKSRVLFGLHESREPLARGAVPVIVEGPVDAIAVTLAGRFAGVAPCGTSLTREQVSVLVRAAPGSDQVIALFDGDDAGRQAAVRSYGALQHAVSQPLGAVLPDGQDPASMSAPALRDVLTTGTVPLADLVIDACLARFDRNMRFIDGKFNALDTIAPLIARMPAHEVARQVTRTAEHTGLTTAEVTAAVTRAADTAVVTGPAYLMATPADCPTRNPVLTASLDQAADNQATPATPARGSSPQRRPSAPSTRRRRT